MRKLAMLLLAVAAGTVMATGSAHAADAKPEDQPKKHVVATGESLSSIATAHTLPSWRPLWDANPQIQHPDQLNVGQELTVPVTPVAERPLPEGYGAPVAAAVIQTAPQPVAAAKPTPTRKVTQAPAAASGDLFARIRARESGGNYATNTGNGYYGAYQFSLGTWQSVGGTGLPSNASPAEQDMRAQILYSQRGCSPWPNTCR